MQKIEQFFQVRKERREQKQEQERNVVTGRLFSLYLLSFLEPEVYKKIKSDLIGDWNKEASKLGISFREIDDIRRQAGVTSLDLMERENPFALNNLINDLKMEMTWRLEEPVDSK